MRFTITFLNTMPMKNLRNTVYIFLVMVLTSMISLAGEVIELATASNNVIVVLVSTHVSEGAPSQEVADWVINGQQPVQVGRHTYVWYQEPDINDMYLLHHIYLDMSDPLESGESYEIVTSAYGTHTLHFDDEKTVCESIHVNQVGYFGGSPSVRYAVLGVYMGDLGSRQLNPVPDYNVLGPEGEIVTSGTVVYWGDHTGGTTGEYVYRIDLSAVPLGGPYVISVEGLGVSYPFGVGPEYVNQATYVQVRGLYHARCGIALESQHTEYTRGVCHPIVEITEANPPTSGDALITDRGPARPISGGYHDAADYDHRHMHTLIPAWMFTLYEAFPDGFEDNQYNIPESGNGIPDWLDEALFGMKVWEELQEEDGGIRAGKEAEGYPHQGVDKADTDPLIYKTYRRYGYTTAMGAGLFAHASRLLAPFDADRSTALLDKAEAAWNYLLDHEGIDPFIASAPVGTRMYATLQLYLATENQDYHDQFVTYANSWISSGDGYLGGVLGNVSGPAFFSYLITDLPAIASLKNTLTQRISSRANVWLGRLSSQPYPIVTIPNYSWGSATAQGRYAEPLIYMYRLTQDNQYLDGVSEMYNYALGLNPLNRSFTTGLGVRTPSCTRSHDSYWFYKDGQGDIPGINVYGIITEEATNRREIQNQIYPDWYSLPREKRFSDGWNMLRSNEWTVTETISQNAIMYGFLSAVGGGEFHSRPQAPSSLEAEPISDHEIRLTWSDAANNATHYKIERRIGENYKEIAIVPADVREYVDAGLQTDKEYTYHIRSYNAGGHSVFSEEVTAVAHYVPPTVEELIDDLIDLIDSEYAGSLNHGQQNGLKSVLNVARNHFIHGRCTPAKNLINAFKNQVSGFMNAGKLTAEQGNVLLEEADEILLLIDQQCGMQNLSVLSERIEVKNLFKDPSYLPNPFNDVTQISFDLELESKVEWAIYTIQGILISKVFSGILSPGNHRMEFNGTELPDGLYVSQLKTGPAGNMTVVQTQKLVKMARP